MTQCGFKLIHAGFVTDYDRTKTVGSLWTDYRIDIIEIKPKTHLPAFTCNIHYRECTNTTQHMHMNRCYHSHMICTQFPQFLQDRWVLEDKMVAWKPCTYVQGHLRPNLKHYCGLFGFLRCWLQNSAWPFILFSEFHIIMCCLLAPSQPFLMQTWSLDPQEELLLLQFYGCCNENMQSVPHFFFMLCARYRVFSSRYAKMLCCQTIGGLNTYMLTYTIILNMIRYIWPARMYHSETTANFRDKTKYFLQ